MYKISNFWLKKTAEIVLSDDKKFVQAIYAKAEALYNTCQFEHALVYFVRGQVRKIGSGIIQCSKILKKVRKKIRKKLGVCTNGS